MGIEHYNKAVSTVDNSAFSLCGYLAWGEYDGDFLHVTSKLWARMCMTIQASFNMANTMRKTYRKIEILHIIIA